MTGRIETQASLSVGRSAYAAYGRPATPASVGWFVPADCSAIGTLDCQPPWKRPGRGGKGVHALG